MGAIRVVHSFSIWIHLAICCKGRVSTTQSSRFRIWLTKFYWGSSAWGARRATAWGTARTIRAPTRTRSLGEQCWSHGTSLVEVSYVSCLTALVHGCSLWSHSGSDTELRPAVTLVAKRICRNFVRKGALATFQWTDVSSHFCCGRDINIMSQIVWFDSMHTILCLVVFVARMKMQPHASARSAPGSCRIFSTAGKAVSSRPGWVILCLSYAGCDFWG